MFGGRICSVHRQNQLFLVQSAYEKCHNDSCFGVCDCPTPRSVQAPTLLGCRCHYCFSPYPVPNSPSHYYIWKPSKIVSFLHRLISFLPVTPRKTRLPQRQPSSFNCRRKPNYYVIDRKSAFSFHVSDCKGSGLNCKNRDIEDSMDK